MTSYAQLLTDLHGLESQREHLLSQLHFEMGNLRKEIDNVLTQELQDVQKKKESNNTQSSCPEQVTDSSSQSQRLSSSRYLRFSAHWVKGL